MPVIILVADGARPDTLASAMDSGALPALERLRAEGELHTISTVFPSVTGPAYAPFLLGRYPGPLGLPGLRWYDRARRCASFPDYARSYVGAELRHMNGDLEPSAPTLFELAPSRMAAMSMIDRGLRAREHVGRGVATVARTARVHFRGRLGGWLDLDRHVARDAVRHVRAHRPEVAFIALMGVDKASHAAGHTSREVMEALSIVDETAAALRADAEQDGRWSHTHLWLVSDHGHSPVLSHDDLAGALAELGLRVAAHPWMLSRRPDVAVMVSGNAMAHLYLEPRRPGRPWWPALAPRWEPLAALLLERPSVDLLLIPRSATECEVRAARRGSAMIEHARGRYSYRPLTGDPLGLGALEALPSDACHERSIDTDYPDGIVQIAHLACAARSGDILLSATRGHDFRARYEPIPHRSAHGALHREHMLVPLLASRPLAGVPRRTVDVMPSALAALGLPLPAGLDGRSFV